MLRPCRPLAEFLRWLAEMPDSFFCGASALRTEKSLSSPSSLTCTRPTLARSKREDVLTAFRPTKTGKIERNRHRWVLAACHLLWHPACDARRAAAQSFVDSGSFATGDGGIGG